VPPICGDLLAAVALVSLPKRTDTARSLTDLMPVDHSPSSLEEIGAVGSPLQPHHRVTPAAGPHRLYRCLVPYSKTLYAARNP
jgi:hypothetical protein